MRAWTGLWSPKIQGRLQPDGSGVVFSGLLQRTRCPIGPEHRFLAAGGVRSGEIFTRDFGFISWHFTHEIFPDTANSMCRWDNLQGNGGILVVLRLAFGINGFLQDPGRGILSSESPVFPDYSYQKLYQVQIWRIQNFNSPFYRYNIR